MFGAWQAGVWKTLSRTLSPDLVVGASVGALNGYAIAAGWSADRLCAFWQDTDVIGFRHLPTAARMLTSVPLQREYAAVLVNPLRMKPVTFRETHVTWRHLVGSCAVPGVVPPVRIDGHWYVDGGLLNPLPLWAAVELGATEIVALHALPEIPSRVLKPFVTAFRWVFGYHPPIPVDVRCQVLVPSQRLGTLTDTVVWKAANIKRWVEQGQADAKSIS
jgi:predicted acylesterase/phospholipase RssA